MLGSHSTKHPAVLSLYAKIRQLLYCPDGLKIPSLEMFKFVMEHFYCFEKEVGINVAAYM